MISGIKWVSALGEIVGGQEVFPHLANEATVTKRTTQMEQVITAEPDVFLASWCGQRVSPERIAARPGRDAIPAVREGNISEIQFPLLLQPGPTAMTNGLDAILAAFASTKEVSS